MKKRPHAIAKLPAMLALTVLLGGCAGFTPVKDASNGPYHAPPGAQSAVYGGMANKQQIAHLQRATFPRLSSTERALIRDVNRHVNQDITYLSDADNYGCPDLAMVEPPRRRPFTRGLPPARYGDCEDYALTKKKRLAAHGMDPSRLFVVRTKVPVTDGPTRHIVLAVPEGSDWWILNNWDNRIETASYLAKWWGWEFTWPRFEEYRHNSQARNGERSRIAPTRRG